MDSGILDVTVICIALIVALKIWHHHYLKAEKKRRLTLTPEQLENELIEDWNDHQW